MACRLSRLARTGVSRGGSRPKFTFIGWKVLGVGVANVMDEGPEGGGRRQYNRGLTSEESNRIDPGQESASGRFQVPLHAGELSGQ
jgi:hypothetical protein